MTDHDGLTRIAEAANVLVHEHLGPAASAQLNDVWVRTAVVIQVCSPTPDQPLVHISAWAGRGDRRYRGISIDPRHVGPLVETLVNQSREPRFAAVTASRLPTGDEYDIQYANFGDEHSIAGVDDLSFVGWVLYQLPQE